MEPWYKVATPLKEVGHGRLFNPDEFANACGALLSWIGRTYRAGFTTAEKAGVAASGGAGGARASGGMGLVGAREL
jgi:hypothetical protein